MKKFYFLFIALLAQTRTIVQIIQNPKHLIDKKNPIVLSTTDNNYFYLVTKGLNLKIKKESGEIEDRSDNEFTNRDYIYIFDKLNNNYLLCLNDYYEIKINYNSFISYEKIIVCSFPKGLGLSMTKIGGIAGDREFILYGYVTNKLLFSSKSQYYRSYENINNINDKLSCKFIKGEDYICGMIINNNLNINCFKYSINILNSYQDSLTKYSNSLSDYNSISSFGLYDSSNNNIKIFCRKANNENTLRCKFFRITINGDFEYELLGDENINFDVSNDFKERNCDFSEFNSEYLFCCGITGGIKCYKINTNNFQKIKEFTLSKAGANTYLTIKSNNEYTTFFFMNGDNSVYEYYIYLNLLV